MKRWKVEVDETVWEANTYIIEAETEEEARKNLLEGYGEGMIELTETYPDTNEITNVRSIKPIEEAT